MKPHAGRCRIIAEAGVNHDGDLGTARALVRAAARAGADAVKFQTFRADALAIPDAPRARYQRAATRDAGSQQDLLRGLELSRDGHLGLMAIAEEEGIEFLSTPYDEESADLLASIGVERFKLASGELTHLDLVRHVARKGLPLILSTGMAELEEVAEAVDAAASEGCPDLTLLHCTSSYPTEPADCHLRAMQTLREAFCLPVGYSDHSRGSEIACAAVALGASMIEKHLTLDRSRQGPDHRVSLPPEEFAGLVRAVRNVESALGSAEKRPTESEREARLLARRGLCASRDLPAGSVLQEGDLLVRRPAAGLPPGARPRVVGKVLRAAMRKYAPLRPEDLR